MAKKKKSSRKKAPVKATPQHNLPEGFWSQIGAVVMVAVSLLFIVAWFNAGGPILDWIFKYTSMLVGYSVYVIPALFIYIAVEIFRSEDNLLPVSMKLATASAIIWFSSLFGLLQKEGGAATGGLLGDLVNKAMLMMVNGTIAAFIYILLIFITMLFIFKVSALTVIKKLWELTRRDISDQEENVKVMRKVAGLDSFEKGSIADFKLNVNVPTSPDESGNEGKRPKLPSLKTGIKSGKTALVTVNDPDWKSPGLDLLEDKQSPANPGDVQGNARIIQDTLGEFDIDVNMEGANIGPRVTQFTLKPTSGIKLSRITALENNLALKLAASHLRIEAPIPGQNSVGIEVPNQKAADVRLHSILTSPQWKNKTAALTFAIGKDISGKVVIGELNEMPHLLIAGQTKAGKSVMINTLLTSLLYHNSPSELKLILIDPKQVEMTAYEDIPHLITPVIAGDTAKTISALKWSVQEMDRRYALLKKSKVKTIGDYNNEIRSKGRKITINDDDGNPQDHENGAMPYVVIVIDELSDLKAEAPKDLENLIVRLAQKGRAAGIHLVVATQSPRKDVITGLIKANIPAKIAFTVSNQLESRIILDDRGAEKLLGHGDMLLSTTNMARMARVQGAWVTDSEVHKVMDYLRMQSPPQYNDEVVSQPVHLNGKGGIVMSDFEEGDDSRYHDAVNVVTESGKASASYLQRRLSVGYSRAAKLIDMMEERGIVGPADGSRPRKVLIDSIDKIGQSEIDDDL